jgi:hypothetical protein
LLLNVAILTPSILAIVSQNLNTKKLKSRDESFNDILKIDTNWSLPYQYQHLVFGGKLAPCRTLSSIVAKGKTTTRILRAGFYGCYYQR